MQRSSNTLKYRTLIAGIGFTTLLAVLMVTLTACNDTASKQANSSGNPQVSDVSEQGEGSYDVMINVSMNEFTFSPDTLRIPAGKAVRLVFENVGVVPHEFMAGRDIKTDLTTFNEDLFSGVDVEMEQGAGAMAMDMNMKMNEDHDNGEEAGEMEHGEEAEEHEHSDGAGEMEHEEEAGEHEHGSGGHGTMLLLQTKTSGSMQFTLPESKRGTWTIGCLQPGHFQAGMKGVLIVE